MENPLIDFTDEQVRLFSNIDALRRLINKGEECISFNARYLISKESASIIEREVESALNREYNILLTEFYKHFSRNK